MNACLAGDPGIPVPLGSPRLSSRIVRCSEMLSVTPNKLTS